MHESSGSQFFKTTTGTQSGPDAFDESVFDDLFNHLGSYRKIMIRLVIEGKTGKEIPKLSTLEFLEKYLAILFYHRQKTTPPGRLIEEIWQIYLC